MLCRADVQSTHWLRTWTTNSEGIVNVRGWLIDIITSICKDGLRLSHMQLRHCTRQRVVSSWNHSVLARICLFGNVRLLHDDECSESAHVMDDGSAFSTLKLFFRLGTKPYDFPVPCDM